MREGDLEEGYDLRNSNYTEIFIGNMLIEYLCTTPLSLWHNARIAYTGIYFDSQMRKFLKLCEQVFIMLR